MQQDSTIISSKRDKKPRIFYGWYIVIASVLSNAYLSTAFFQGFSVFFLPIVNEFGWTRAQTSVAFSLRQLEIGILAPLMGFLVDRLGGRKVIIICMVISGFGLVLMSRINSLWTFYATFALISVGVSGASHGISWPTVVAAWFNRLRGRALGFTFLGPVVGAPAIILVVLLEQAVGWRLSVLYLGIGIWLVGIPLGVLARSNPTDYGYLPDGDLPNEETKNEPADPKNPREDFPSDHMMTGHTATMALQTKAFWLLVGLYGLHGIGLSGFFVHQIPFFEHIGFSTAQSAMTVSVMFTASGIGRLSAGFLMDLIDWRIIMLVVMITQTLDLFALIYVSEYWQALVFSVIMGIGFGATIPSRPILVGKYFGMRAYGTIQGLLQGSAIASGVAGPIIMGWVFDQYLSYNPAIVGFTALTALTIPVILLCRNPETNYNYS